MGQSGGLALFWVDDLIVEIQNYSRCHINAIVESEGNGQTWKFTGFYSHLEVGHQAESWNLLGHLCSLDPIPWLCLGDFNEILVDEEKWGGGQKARWQMENFRQILATCHLEDLGYMGPDFTWCNK